MSFYDHKTDTLYISEGELEEVLKSPELSHIKKDDIEIMGKEDSDKITNEFFFENKWSKIE